MKPARRFRKTSFCFLIVLFVVALTTRSIVGGGSPKAPFESRNESDSNVICNEILFGFDGKLDPRIQHSFNDGSKREKGYPFTKGLKNQSLIVGRNKMPASAKIPLGRELKFGQQNDFSIEFWIRTTAHSSSRFVVLANKQLPDNSLQSQKKKGWAFGVANGTWTWNIGSGNRRLTYERDNGHRMPINDGRWHQCVMTYDHTSSLVRLYFDGTNWVTYNLADDEGFDFASQEPLIIGWPGEVDSRDAVLPMIKAGAKNLQDLVDTFNGLGLGDLKPDELMHLVIGPERLIQNRLAKETRPGVSIAKERREQINKMVRGLSQNPYTVHQVADFMQVAPLLKLYRLDGRQVEINRPKADEFAQQEKFCRPNFDLDELSIFQRKLGPNEVAKRYSKFFRIATSPPRQSVGKLTAAAFNIHHGGKHETVEEDGWDSRKLIAELIRREGIDVVMMQETYSSGDFIAAELGYYFATTVDRDYLNQGSNISILSRYPIKEVIVPPKSSFMNVAARISVSRSQEIFAMSNWYGMRNFPDVFNFHKSRFLQSDKIPILFAGDFNAIPHIDGGNSPASKALLNAGFRDAYRSCFPNSKTHPGPTHRSGHRIDQLYFKGSWLKHLSTNVLSKWPSKFPSDHYLIKSVFQLDVKTTRKNR